MIRHRGAPLGARLLPPVRPFGLEGEPFSFLAPVSFLAFFFIGLPFGRGGHGPAIKPAKTKMSGYGNKRKRSSGSVKKAKQLSKSKRPRAVTSLVKSAAAAPTERPGDCKHGPAEVETFPAMIKAIQGVYISHCQCL